MSVFGVMTGPWDVEQAVLKTLKEWLPAHLLDLEEKHSFKAKELGRPPAPESYKGGLDWESVRQEYLPAIIAHASPVGEPERTMNAYNQAFEVQVGCVIYSAQSEEPEAIARRNAGMFATACMGVLVQHGKLALPAEEEIVLTASPMVEFFDPERRDIAVGVTGWRCYCEIVDPNAGPGTLKEVEPEGPYPEYEEVETHTVTVVGTPVETPL